MKVAYDRQGTCSAPHTFIQLYWHVPQRVPPPPSASTLRTKKFRPGCVSSVPGLSFSAFPYEGRLVRVEKPGSRSRASSCLVLLPSNRLGN